MGGIGEMNKNRHPNFLVVDKSKKRPLIQSTDSLLNICLFFADTPVTDIEDTLKKFIRRDDIDIILINQNVIIL